MTSVSKTIAINTLDLSELDQERNRQTKEPISHSFSTPRRYNHHHRFYLPQKDHDLKNKTYREHEHKYSHKNDTSLDKSNTENSTVETSMISSSSPKKKVNNTNRKYYSAPSSSVNYTHKASNRKHRNSVNYMNEYYSSHNNNISNLIDKEHKNLNTIKRKKSKPFPHLPGNKSLGLRANQHSSFVDSFSSSPDIKKNETALFNSSSKKRKLNSVISPRYSKYKEKSTPNNQSHNHDLSSKKCSNKIHNNSSEIKEKGNSDYNYDINNIKIRKNKDNFNNCHSSEKYDSIYLNKNDSVKRFLQIDNRSKTPETDSRYFPVLPPLSHHEYQFRDIKNKRLNSLGVDHLSKMNESNEDYEFSSLEIEGDEELRKYEQLEKDVHDNIHRSVLPPQKRNFIPPVHETISKIDLSPQEHLPRAEIYRHKKRKSNQSNSNSYRRKEHSLFNMNQKSPIRRVPGPFRKPSTPTWMTEAFQEDNTPDRFPKSPRSRVDSVKTSNEHGNERSSLVLTPRGIQQSSAKISSSRDELPNNVSPSYSSGSSLMYPLDFREEDNKSDKNDNDRNINNEEVEKEIEQETLNTNYTPFELNSHSNSFSPTF
eukprot:gb/GECH01002752.1/.p1 GENE.gb/GECH01002752.1/~~gb/GECH01002752.1/.p1  ORF type:complete len:596 (+),score=158.74 gb/GECH01002752.1/:1-1788(+)